MLWHIMDGSKEQLNLTDGFLFVLKGRMVITHFFHGFLLLSMHLLDAPMAIDDIRAFLFAHADVAISITNVVPQWLIYAVGIAILDAHRVFGRRQLSVWHLQFCLSTIFSIHGFSFVLAASRGMDGGHSSDCVLHCIQ